MIGFIGAGNMATALMQGMIAGGRSASDLMAYDISEARRRAMADMGVAVAESVEALAGACELLVLAIKPKDTAALLESHKAALQKTALLSIVTGWTQQMLTAALPDAVGVGRSMPNTPARVGEGVIALNANHGFVEAQFALVQRTLTPCGRIVVVPEMLFDAVTAVSGSGPAYVYLFIEALADAGLRQGLARETAYTLAAQTALGAAKMVLETGLHPGALKDSVASPAGTTIEAVYALEKAGFRGAVMDAVDACARKAAQMGK